MCTFIWWTIIKQYYFTKQYHTNRDVGTLYTEICVRQTISYKVHRANFTKHYIINIEMCTTWTMLYNWDLHKANNTVQTNPRLRRTLPQYYTNLFQMWGGGGRGGRLTSLDASFARCFAFLRTSSKTSTPMFFQKHCQNIASLREKHDVFHDALGFWNSIKSHGKSMVIQPKM